MNDNPGQMSVGGDTAGGWLVDIHDGEQASVQRPDGETADEATKQAMAQHVEALPEEKREGVMQRLQVLWNGMFKEAEPTQTADNPDAAALLHAEQEMPPAVTEALAAEAAQGEAWGAGTAEAAQGEAQSEASGAGATEAAEATEVAQTETAVV